MAYFLPLRNNIAPGATGHIMDHDDLADVMTGNGLVFNVLNTTFAGGADPTGVADSTAAIQAAINAAYLATTIPSGNVVTIPCGTYLTTAPINIPPYVSVVGTQGAMQVGTQVHGPVITPSASFSAGSQPVAAVFLLLNPTDGGYATDSEEQKIRSLSVNGQNLAATTVIHGIATYGQVKRMNLRDLVIANMTGSGYISVMDGTGAFCGRIDAEFMEVRFCGLSTTTTCHAYDIHVSDGRWFRCSAASNGGASNASHGFKITSSGDSSWVMCHAEHNFGSGFHYEDTTAGIDSGGILFTGCSTDGNDQHGFSLTNDSGSAVPVTITGCNFRRDGYNQASGGGGFAGINIGQYNSAVNITGCQVYPGKDDAGTGPNTPEYGMAVNGAAQTYITVTGTLLWAATAPLNNDGAAPLVAFDSNCVFATGTDGNPTFYAPAAKLIAASQANALPTVSEDLYTARPNAVSATGDRRLITSSYTLATSGTLYMVATTLYAGVPVSNVAMWVAGQSKTGGQHGWYCVTDMNRIVLARSADQTDGSTTWGSTTAEQSLPMASPAVPGYTGLGYYGIMVAASGNMPAIGTFGTVDSGIAAQIPVLFGSSGTGLTTPPAVGSTMATITAIAAANLYAFGT